MRRFVAASAAFCCAALAAGPLAALQAETPAPATPEVVAAAAPPTEELPDPATLKMPDLAFAPTPEIVADYDKYFYFHRESTGFLDAYNDVKECDALASGISYYGGNSAAMAGATVQYGVLAAGLGTAIGSVVADAIFGSAERRKMRRVNMRNCMGFKGYQRYPLTHDLWEKFNFEEGMGRKQETVRQDALVLQALVASGPKPLTGALPL
jgi:hypothetical protein